MPNNDSIFDFSSEIVYLGLDIHTSYDSERKLWITTVRHSAPDYTFYVSKTFTDKDAFANFVHRYDRFGNWERCGYLGAVLHKFLRATIHA